jgi:hypothetical protein
MEQNATRFLPARLALLLALAAAFLGLATTWITGALGSWLPLSGSIPLTSLPHILCGIAVVLAAILAPLTTQTTATRITLTQIAFAGLFQGAAFQYFMMVTARLVPLDPAGIALSSLGVALFAFCCVLIAEALPRAYCGLLFFWVVAVPVICFITADIFVSGPGRVKGWQAAESSALIYSMTHALLALSPGTAITAMLDGALPDGSYALPAITLTTLAVLSASLVILRMRLSKRKTSAPAELEPARTSA